MEWFYSKSAANHIPTLGGPTCSWAPRSPRSALSRSHDDTIAELRDSYRVAVIPRGENFWSNSIAVRGSRATIGSSASLSGFASSSACQLVHITCRLEIAWLLFPRLAPNEARDSFRPPTIHCRHLLSQKPFLFATAPLARPLSPVLSLSASFLRKHSPTSFLRGKFSFARIDRQMRKCDRQRQRKAASLQSYWTEKLDRPESVWLWNWRQRGTDEQNWPLLARCSSHGARRPAPAIASQICSSWLWIRNVEPAFFRILIQGPRFSCSDLQVAETCPIEILPFLTRISHLRLKNWWRQEMKISYKACQRVEFRPAL